MKFFATFIIPSYRRNHTPIAFLWTPRADLTDLDDIIIEVI